MTTAPMSSARYTVARSSAVSIGAIVAPMPDDCTEAEAAERALWLNRGESPRAHFGWQPLPDPPPSNCWVIVDTEADPDDTEARAGDLVDALGGIGGAA